MNKTPLIEVNNLCIDFPKARVVNNVSFSLGQERLAVVGESGSGKSMTARALMGLVRQPGKVSADKLNLQGNNLLDFSSRQWNNIRGNTISMVLQDPRYALNPVKTIYQQVEETVKQHQNFLAKIDVNLSSIHYCLSVYLNRIFIAIPVNYQVVWGNEQ